jgi:hypothetical protein
MHLPLNHHPEGEVADMCWRSHFITCSVSLPPTSLARHSSLPTQPATSSLRLPRPPTVPHPTFCPPYSCRPSSTRLRVLGADSRLLLLRRGRHPMGALGRKRRVVRLLAHAGHLRVPGPQALAQLVRLLLLLTQRGVQRLQRTRAQRPAPSRPACHPQAGHARCQLVFTCCETPVDRVC